VTFPNTGASEVRVPTSRYRQHRRVNCGGRRGRWPLGLPPTGIPAAREGSKAAEGERPLTPSRACPAGKSRADDGSKPPDVHGMAALRGFV
jgi:hypothetical protein